MSVLVKALVYYGHEGAGGLVRAKRHLEYLEYGKEHRHRPGGFDQERDQVTRAEFTAWVQAKPARGVIAHKLVISLIEDERNR